MANYQLGKIEREKRPEVFELTLTDGETVVTFADPKRLHFTVLTAIDDMAPAKQIETLTGSGWPALREDPEMDGEALEWVMGLWRDHYGMGSPGEPGSSSGS